MLVSLSGAQTLCLGGVRLIPVRMDLCLLPSGMLTYFMVANIRESVWMGAVGEGRVSCGSARHARTPASPATGAIRDMKREGELWRLIRHRRGQLLNSMVVQDHRQSSAEQGRCSVFRTFAPLAVANRNDWSHGDWKVLRAPGSGPATIKKIVDFDWRRLAVPDRA